MDTNFELPIVENCAPSSDVTDLFEKLKNTKLSEDANCVVGGKPVTDLDPIMASKESVVEEEVPVVPVKVFDVNTAPVEVEKLQKGIKAPYVFVQKSALGGAENVSILITVSLDAKENWHNQILQNSRYFMIHFSNKGVMDQFSGNVSGKDRFRKTRVKSVDEALTKINAYIDRLNAGGLKAPEGKFGRDVSVKESGNVFDYHQKKIAVDTVKNPAKALLGGPSVEEAEKTLREKFGYTDEMIAKLKESIVKESKKNVVSFMDAIISCKKMNEAFHDETPATKKYVAALGELETLIERLRFSKTPTNYEELNHIGEEVDSAVEALHIAANECVAEYSGSKKEEEKA
jgi:hypothetical protein